MSRRFDDETLSGRLDGELDATDARRIDAALSDSPEDRARFDHLRALDNRLGQWFQDHEPDIAPLESAVRHRFTQRRMEDRSDRKRVWLVPAAAAVAAMLVIVAGLAGFDYMIDRRVNAALDRMRAERASDIALLASAVQEVLETRESGEAVTFTNASTGLSVSIRPQRTWRSASGHWCREFIEVVGETRPEAAPVSKACRTSDGKWVRVLTQLPGGQAPVILETGRQKNL